MKKSLIKSVDSSNKMMPKITVPKVPMPVQTAYAVPRGIPLTAIERKTKLSIINIIVMTDGRKTVNPSEYFKPIAQPISSNPATINNIHSIITPYYGI